MLTLSDLDALPRRGWLGAPTPVSELAGLAGELGLGWLGVKRDDRIDALHGGTKVRKLDLLLAGPPFDVADAWAGLGALGSGNLVALTAAAQALSRRLDAFVFWAEPSPHELENLAFVASGPTRVRFSASATRAALRHPALLVGAAIDGAPVVPPGASAPRAILGLVRAGLELAGQIEAGELPRPDRVVLALGSGGTTVGLALGLALAGLSIPVVGVRVVARLFARHGRLRALERGARKTLTEHGVVLPDVETRIEVDQGHAGRGYAIPTRASLRACARLADEGLHLEPVYTGKAMAALFDAAPRWAGEKVLFWLTARSEALPHRDDWRARLPADLARALAFHADPAARAAQTRRRRVLGGGAAVAIGVTAGLRLSGYDDRPGLRELAPWEAQVIEAAAEALLDPAPPSEARRDLAARVDRYLVPLPKAMQRDVHAVLALVEHGTTPLSGRWHRMSALPPREREAWLSGLAAKGGLLAQAYGAIRDLCMLGAFQRPEAWGAIDYDGPMVPLDYDPSGPDRLPAPAYEAMRAPRGARPRSMT